MVPAAGSSSVRVVPGQLSDADRVGREVGCAGGEEVLIQVLAGVRRFGGLYEDGIAYTVNS